RRAPEADAQGVRSPVVPSLTSATRVHARRADGSRVGLPERTRHRHADGPHPPPARKDRRRSGTASPLGNGLGPRLPVQPMIEVALILAGVTLVVGIGAALGLRLLPTVRLQVTGLALLAVVLPLVAVLASGWVMFHMHDDAKILAVSSAAALSAVAGALLLGRWIVGPLERLRDVSGVVDRKSVV